MKLAFLSIIIFSFVNISIGQFRNEKPFVLKGKLKGKYTGYGYLNYISRDRGLTDSCLIIKGHFILKGMISEPCYASFSTFNIDNKSGFYDLNNIMEFYLESSVMKLSVTVDHFDSFQLEGSKTDKDRLLLLKLEEPINSLIKPINAKCLTELTEYQKERKKKTDTARINSLSAMLKTLYKQLEPLYAKRRIIDSLFINNHPFSFVAADMLWHKVRGGEIKLATLETLYNRFPLQIKETLPGRGILNVIEAGKAIRVGDSAKIFIALDEKGDTVRLTDYKGKKYILLDFWASWCAPCRENIPLLIDIYKKYSDKMEIISIANQEQEDEWKKAISNEMKKWVQILENKSLYPSRELISELYHINTIPFLILIDTNLNIIGRFGSGANTKPISELGVELEKAIR